MDVTPYQFWLEPGERSEGKARIYADEKEPFENKERHAPLLILEGLVKQGDTRVLFGSISSVVHAVRRVHLETKVISPGDQVIFVSGWARTDEAPVRQANVSLHILAQDGETEAGIIHTRTDNQGEFSLTLHAPSGATPNDLYYLEVALSPTPGTGPAVSNLIACNFK